MMRSSSSTNSSSRGFALAWKASTAFSPVAMRILRRAMALWVSGSMRVAYRVRRRRNGVPREGRGSCRIARPLRTPSPVPEFPRAVKKDPPTISFAVSEFLAELPLDGGERVLGSLALELTAALEKAPGYSKARLATSCVSWSGSCPQAEMERRREEATVEAIARKSAEHEAGVRRQKALLAELGVPDASPVGRGASTSV